MSQPNNPLTYRVAESTIAPGIHVLQSQGNALAIDTDAGIVLVDSGPGGRGTEKLIEGVRERSTLPLHAICYSHGHLGYNAGVAQWQEHNASRGEPAPRLIAHENLVRRFHRYRETMDLQKRLAELQFRLPIGVISGPLAMTDPTETFGDRMEVVGGERSVELLWAPSETDDAIAVWLPEERILYGGAGVIASIPNVGTPLRSLRDPIRWAESLETLAALEPRIAVREFGDTIEGEEEIQRVLLATAEALRWLRREVVERMNRGMGVEQIVAELEYPGDLFYQTWMAPVYGCPEYIVRDIFRAENGWWDRNPTHLHPAPPDEAARAVLSAIADPSAVIVRAKELAQGDQVQLALHVIDLLARAPGDEPELQEARALKATWLRQIAKSTLSFVSQSLYISSANLIEKDAGRPLGIT